MKFSRYESDLRFEGFKRFRLDGQLFLVNLIGDGVYEMIPRWGTEIEENAKAVEDCLQLSSEFVYFVEDHFRKREYDYHLDEIYLVFNGVDFLVNRKNAKVETIIQLYNREKAKKRKQKQQRRRFAVKQMIYKAKKKSQIDFENEEAQQQWEQFVEKNSQDKDGRCIVSNIEAWMKFMQYIMKKHNKPVHLIARSTSEYVGTRKFNRDYAVEIISQVWKHGDALKKIWNKNIS